MYLLDTFFCVSVQKHVIINYIKYALITICRHAIKDRILSNMNILQKCYRIFSILLIFLFFCYIVLLHKLKKYNVHALMNGYSYDLSMIRLRKEALWWETRKKATKKLADFSDAVKSNPYPIRQILTLNVRF